MRLRRRRAEAEVVDIVPMIDVAFFLLVFFLLVGRMEATAPFELRPPDAAAATDLPSGGLVLALDREGALSVSGEVLAPAAAVAAIRRRLAEEPGLWVRLEADREAPLRHLLPLIVAVEESGARDVVLVVAEGGG